MCMITQNRDIEIVVPKISLYHACSASAHDETTRMDRSPRLPILAF